MPLARPPTRELNAFGRLFRQWRTLHPYNAAQAMHLRRGEDVAAHLERAVAPLGTCREELRHVTGALDAHLSAELNEPFDDDDPVPLRGFWLPDGDDDGGWAGLCYDHWLADSVAIRQIMCRWAAGAVGCPLEPIRTPTRPAGDRLPSLAGVIGLARRNAVQRRVRRVLRRGSLDAAYLHRPMPIGSCDRLLGASRRLGVKMNDLFVAAAARAAVGLLTAARPYRDMVGVGTIIDTRPALPPASRQAFGLHLSFRNSLFRPEEVATLPAAARAAAWSAASAKTGADHDTSALSIRAALLAGRFLEGRRLVEFYRKRLPLVAGVSNVNLDRSPVTQLFPDKVDNYLRVSPLGPTVAIVFTPTTLGGELSLGVTYRTALLTADEARACTDAFVADLVTLR